MGNNLTLDTEVFAAQYSSGSTTDGSQQGASFSALVDLNETVTLGARYSMITEYENSNNDNKFKKFSFR